MLTALLTVALTAVQSPDSAEALASRVEIVRTEYGIPHILADDLKAMGFGLGYVQSEDFSASIATALVQSRGTLARYTGADALDDDFVAREEHARAVQTFSRLDPRAQAVYAGFAEGVNHYVRLHRDEFPEWMPADFTGVDALARDVQTWSRGDAARFVRAYEAAQEGRAPEPSPEDLLEAEARALDGSNAWAIDGSRTDSGNAVLLRNPHLSWATDARLLERVSGSTYYEAHVRVPGVLEFYGDFRIGTAFGIIGGFNARLGWATTNNYPRYSQVYALEAHPDLAEHAMLDGRPLPLEERRRTVDYRLEDGSKATETRSTWWTAHGPVIHRDGDRIFILKDPRDGEYRRGEQFLRMMLATNLDEWLEVMRMRAHPSSNFTYADADGNIAHYYNARLPLLPHGMTEDTAAIATRTADIWSELVPWDDLPLYVNPPGGYVQQANDPPDFTNLNVPLDRDTVAANLPEPRLRLRSQLSLDLIGGTVRLSLDELNRLKHTTRMPMAERVLDDLVRVLRDSRPERGDDVARAIEILEAWDRTAGAESRGGVLFKEWAFHYMSPPDTAGLWAEPWDIERPTETPRGIGNEAWAIVAMDSAFTSLRDEGIRPDAAWGDVHRVVRGDVDEPAPGCEPTLGCFRALSFQDADGGRREANRGDAWVLWVEFADDGPHARTVLSYGQTAREESPHYDDQAGMFARGELKTVAWTDADIARVTLERYRPGREARR